MIAPDSALEASNPTVSALLRVRAARMIHLLKPLYGLTPVPRVRIPPCPPDVLTPAVIIVLFMGGANPDFDVMPSATCRDESQRDFGQLESVTYEDGI